MDRLTVAVVILSIEGSLPPKIKLLQMTAVVI